jgi:hypothetical protein
VYVTKFCTITPFCLTPFNGLPRVRPATVIKSALPDINLNGPVPPKTTNSNAGGNGGSRLLSVTID